MALNFYNSQGQNKQPKDQFASSQPRTNTALSSGSPFAGHSGTGWLSDPQWGSGSTFQHAARRGSIDSLMGGMSQANPADYAAMDQLRGYYTGMLDKLPSTEANRMSQFDTQSQRGLANLLTQHRNSQAGTGNLGSRQFSGQQGDITSRVANDYMRGVMDNRTRSLQDAGMIHQGLGNLYNQDLMERRTQYGYGQDMSNMLNNMWGQEEGRVQALAGQQEDSNWLADIAPLVGMGAGFAIGGPAGAMVGGQFGGAAGQALGGGGGGGGGGSNLASLLAMQNMQNKGGMPSESPMMGNWGPTPPGAHQGSGLSNNPYYPGNEYWRSF